MIWRIVYKTLELEANTRLELIAMLNNIVSAYLKKEKEVCVVVMDSDTYAKWRKWSCESLQS